MAENSVSRREFESLKKEVFDLKNSISNNANLLQKIDKKVDIIDERILNANQIEELKIKPISERLKKVEDNQSWIWRTIGATLIGIAIKVIFDISNFLN